MPISYIVAIKQDDVKYLWQAWSFLPPEAETALEVLAGVLESIEEQRTAEHGYLPKGD